mmetsp:Transcript_28891/g.60682  ORF Transcript_28891/g.60682 Transcript_28891/m.60682 type:complete len:346 (-) Transcript_28891:87-1124(-)
MSPSLVKARLSKLQDYFKLLVKDAELVKEPVVRIFLKLPMTTEEVERIASGADGDGLLGGCGTFKSLYQRTREEKAKGIHHTQKREMFAGPPTLQGASEVGAAFAGSSVHDAKDGKKWVFRIPILADFGGQTVKDVFGGEVRGLHSTYNNQIKAQVTILIPPCTAIIIATLLRAVSVSAVSVMTHGCVDGPGGALEQGHGGKGQGQGQAPSVAVQAHALVKPALVRITRPAPWLADSARRRQSAKLHGSRCWPVGLRCNVEGVRLLQAEPGLWGTASGFTFSVARLCRWLLSPHPTWDARPRLAPPGPRGRGLQHCSPRRVPATLSRVSCGGEEGQVTPPLFLRL